MARAKRALADEQDFNRWCIEMALRWPVIHLPPSHPYGAAQGGLGYGQASPARDVDADVIGRANKIAAWVKESH
jgi:hypothetical protein